jgi:hypothetical protein
MQSLLKRTFVLVTVTIAMVLSISVAPAQAVNSAAYNRTEHWLTANPTDEMTSVAVQRRIYLTAGTYEWYQIPYLTGCRRISSLGSGWYTWTDTLDPKDGYYRRTSVLDPDNPAWGSSSLICAWFPRESGTYSWGSALAPQS